MDKDQESSVQQDFEEWASKHHGIYSIGKVNDHYSNEKVSNDWFVWKAAHSKYHEDTYTTNTINKDTDIGYDAQEISEYLNKSGIKHSVKICPYTGKHFITDIE